MAKKKLTPAQLKDRKTKRLAIGLSVVLVGVIAFQAPTILNLVNGGGSSNASAPPPATSSTTTTTSGSGAAAPSAAAGSSPVAVASFTPLATGSLTQFGSFAGKDPFHAQLGTATAGATSPTSTTPTTKGASTPPVTKAPKSPSTPKTTKLAPALPVTAPTTTVPFTTTPAAPPNAAVIMTNGKRQVVPVGKGFPRGAPLFKLVSLATHPKAIRISVLGGSFTSGAPTMLLRRGARLELDNESNGVRYTITLVGLMATTTSPSATGSSGSTG